MSVQVLGPEMFFDTLAKERYGVVFINELRVVVLNCSICQEHFQFDDEFLQHILEHYDAKQQQLAAEGIKSEIELEDFTVDPLGKGLGDDDNEEGEQQTELKQDSMPLHEQVLISGTPLEESTLEEERICRHAQLQNLKIHQNREYEEEIHLKEMEEAKDPIECEVNEEEVQIRLTNEPLEAGNSIHIPSALKAKGKAKARPKCEICGRVFAFYTALIVHRRRHLGDARHKCSYCDMRFYTTEELKSHQRRHTGNYAHRCQYCGVGYDMLMGLKRHEIRHTEEQKKRVMTINPVSISKKLQIEDKFKGATSEKEDEEYLTVESDLEGQTEAGSSKKPKLKCEICGKLYAFHNALIVHRRRHMGDARFSCGYCDLKFYTNDTAKKHEKRHTMKGQYSCPHCGVRYNKVNHLTRHLMMHEKERKTETLQASTCKQADHESADSDAEEAPSIELAPDSGDETRNETAIETSSKASDFLNTTINAKIPTCDICGRTFAFPNALLIHRRRHVGDARYSCRLCDMKFYTNDSLKSHKRRHAGNYPHRCEQCGMGYNFSSHLKTHERVHEKKTPRSRLEITIPGETKKEDEPVEQERKIEGTPKHKCDICQQTFSFHNALLLHRRRHLGDARYSCSFCDMRFYTNDSLKQHERRHKADFPYRCKYCGLGYDLARKVKTHEKRHENATYVATITKHEQADRSARSGDKNRAKAFVEESKDVDNPDSKANDLADLDFPTADTSVDSDDSTQNLLQLASAIKSKKSDDLPSFSTFHTCAVCQEKFNDRDELHAHERCHFTGNQYKCKYCKMTFSSFVERRVHETNGKGCKHVPKADPNKILAIATNTKNTTEDTINEKRDDLEPPNPNDRLKCKFCERSFRFTSNLNEHQRRYKHFDVTERPHACKHCGVHYRSKACRDRHERQHELGTLKKKIKVFGDFTCDVCGRHFTKKEFLKMHQIRIHGHSSRFECSTCGKGFGYRYELERHERCHTGECPFLCSYCGRGFTNVPSRDRHEHHHEIRKQNLRSFKCSICEKAFNFKRDLTIHMRRHAGERRYACKVCPAKFVFSNQLKMHEKIHENARSYVCNICGKGFNQTATRYLHMKNTHKVAVVPTK